VLKKNRESSSQRLSQAPIRVPAQRWRLGRTERQGGEEEKAVFHSTAGTCYLCRGQLVFENRMRGLPGAWHIEHVIPFATNPEMDVCANLLPARAECNVTKGART
jgi:hypothetical protein